MSTDSDLEYFKSLDDYEDIAPFLDSSDEFDFKAPVFAPDLSSSVVVDCIPVIPAGVLQTHV